MGGGGGDLKGRVALEVEVQYDLGIVVTGIIYIENGRKGIT